MYKYTIAAYLCKTEALRMQYLGRGFCLDGNTRFLNYCLYHAEYQLDASVHDTVTTTIKKLRKQLGK